MGSVMRLRSGWIVGVLWLGVGVACDAPGVPRGSDAAHAVDGDGDADASGSTASARADARSVPRPPAAGSASSTGGDGEPLPICVNEWVASNIGGLRLADGERPDWLELFNPGEVAVSLDGWSIADSDDPDDAELLDASLVVPAGGALVLFADGRSELGPRHLGMSLAADGETIALYAPDGRGDVVHYGEVDSDLAVTRTTDCCRGEGCWSFVRGGSPGVSNIDGGVTREVFISARTEWRYLDTNVMPDASWTAVSFDDSSWARGMAPLGYADAHHATGINGGPGGARHISTWFREAFFVGDAPAIHDLELALMVDDGARVWLNGVEVLQVNMPVETELTSSTLARYPVTGISESALIRYAIDGSMLVTGVNVLAVEVHAVSTNDDDLSLDAQLTGIRL